MESGPAEISEIGGLFPPRFRNGRVGFCLDEWEKLDRLDESSREEEERSNVFLHITLHPGGSMPASESSGIDKLPDRVLVYARVKPASPSGSREVATRCVDHDAEDASPRDGKSFRSIRVVNPNAAVVRKTFDMDRCLGPRSTQHDVYEAVGAPVLDSVLRGCHGAILGYGQTGSGKTHSLLNLGDGGEAGLVPRLAVDLFTRIAADWTHMYDVEIAMMQIYNETVMDLLKPNDMKRTPGNSERGLRACQRKASAGGGWELLDCTWYRCKSPEHLLDCFRQGRKGLVYAETMMNKHSSRSHCVLQLKVNRVPRPDNTTVMPQFNSSGYRRTLELLQHQGLLTVVDMAGSERVKKTLSEGIRFSEATNINTSLLAFGNVMQALAEKRNHVPYRDSMLTKILESSLSGRSRTALLVCLAPELEHSHETTTSLEFASRAMRVTTVPVVHSANVEFDPADLTRELAEAASNSALQKMGEEVLSSRQMLDREKAERAEKEDHLCDLITRERAERADVEEKLRRRLAEAEAEIASLSIKLSDAKTEAHNLSDELAHARIDITAAEECRTKQRIAAEELERELALEREASREAAQNLADSMRALERDLVARQEAEKLLTEQRLRDSFESERAQHGASEVQLRHALEREKAERMEMETELRGTILREQKQRIATENEMHELLRRETSIFMATQSELQEALDLEKSDRVKVESNLRQRLSELEENILTVKQQLADAAADNAKLKEDLTNAQKDAAAARERFHEQKKVTDALDCELKLEREVLQQSAARLSESAEEKEIFAQQICTLEEKLKETSLAKDIAESTIENLEASRQSLIDEMKLLRENWHSGLAELQKASTAAVGQVETAARLQLAAGAAMFKRGRNGKIYRRMVRCSVDTNTLEWAPLGEFRKMSVRGAHIDWMPDGSGFVIRGPERDLRLELTDTAVASWARALDQRLPRSESTRRICTPLRFGNPMQKAFGSFMTPSRKLTPTPESQPMSPGGACRTTAELAARQLANLGAPNKVLFK